MSNIPDDSETIKRLFDEKMELKKNTQILVDALRTQLEACGRCDCGACKKAENALLKVGEKI